MRVFCILAACMLAPAAGAQCTAPGRPYAAQAQEADLLYLPTPAPVVTAMLRLAGVSAADVVYDLGSGDGRIPIAAAREHGARGVGIELDARLIELARCSARAAGVEKRVEFREQDFFKADL